MPGAVFCRPLPAVCVDSACQHMAVMLVPYVQIHLGLSGTNSYWVMWATGTGKVCLIHLLGCANPEVPHVYAKAHLPLWTIHTDCLEEQLKSSVWVEPTE